MIQIHNLKKIYPGKPPTEALKDVSFEVFRGEFLTVMGRSGSGKSTFLHQLGLIDTPTEGEIIIDGINVLNLSDSEKTKFRLEHLGYVFQEYALISELTAWENTYLPARALSDDNNYKMRAKKVLEIVGLKDRLDHYPHELSGGEQQRVAIARALINKPKILFADEPTANLDSHSSKIILDLFQKLRKDFDQTIVMVTHEQEDKRYADRVLWMKDGLVEKIEQIKIA